VCQIMAAAETALAGREHYVPSDRVFAVTGASRLSAYDAEFVALAEILGAPLVTENKWVLAAFVRALTIDDAVESL
jgi:predicted nucleic acid-binding protein